MTNRGYRAAVKHLLAAVVALAFAASASAAESPGFHESPLLEPAASFVAGKPATVWCANTRSDWNAYAVSVGQTGTVNGLTSAGANETRLSWEVCSNLVAKKGGKAVVVANFAASLLVLTHESIHMRGNANEGSTDCAAVHEMPRVAVRFFPVKAGRPLRAVMAAAWAYRRTEPAAYKTVC